MLNAQGIHHLHISTHVEPDGYVKRDGPLLFAVFKERAAYLIDIMGHGDWTRDHVLKVLAAEWPDEGIIHEIKGGEGFKVIGLSRNYTEAERAHLQKHGINTAVDIGGKIVMPGGLITTAGTTFNATRAADEVLRQIDAFVERYVKKPKKLRALFEGKGFAFPKGTPKFEFAIQRDGCGVIETVTKTWIRFNSLPLSA
jgi:hypothetical protein